MVPNVVSPGKITVWGMVAKFAAFVGRRTSRVVSRG